MCGQTLRQSYMHNYGVLFTQKNYQQKESWNNFCCKIQILAAIPSIDPIIGEIRQFVLSKAAKTSSI